MKGPRYKRPFLTYQWKKGPWKRDEPTGHIGYENRMSLDDYGSWADPKFNKPFDRDYQVNS